MHDPARYSDHTGGVSRSRRAEGHLHLHPGRPGHASGIHYGVGARHGPDRLSFEGGRSGVEIDPDDSVLSSPWVGRYSEPPSSAARILASSPERADISATSKRTARCGWSRSARTSLTGPSRRSTSTPPGRLRKWCGCMSPVNWRSTGCRSAPRASTMQRDVLASPSTGCASSATSWRWWWRRPNRLRWTPPIWSGPRSTRSRQSPQCRRGSATPLPGAAT